MSCSVDDRNPGPGEDQTSFSCSVCSKVFKNGPSRNRHVLYCRQKLFRQCHSRKKSCTHCRHAKTRCNEAIPQCARCETKMLECVYDNGHPKDSSLQLQGLEGGRDGGIGPDGSITDQVSLLSHPNSLSFLQLQGLEEDKSRRDAGLGLVGPTTNQAFLPGQMSTIGGRDLSCEDLSCEGDIYQNTHISPVTTSYNPLIDLGNGEDSEVGFQFNSLTSSYDYLLDPSLHCEIDFPRAPQHRDKDSCFGADRLVKCTAQNMHSSTLQLAESYYPPGPSQVVSQLESQISLQYPQESLFDSSHLAIVDAKSGLLSAEMESISSETHKKGLLRRRQGFIGSQLSCYYLIQTLRSYPKMMLSDTLPPFIHEKCGGFDGRQPLDSIEIHLSLKEPLAICKNVTHMYFSKTKESTSFFWRTIEMELIRLDMEYQNFDDWTLIAALQALAIYILLATIEGDNLPPSIDARLLHVMSAVATKTEEPDHICSTAQYKEWQEWLLKESKHRTFTLLFIINMLFDINPSHNPNACNAISAIPVPAHKSLWQAASYVEWKKAQTEFLKTREVRPSLTYGDIISLHQKTQVTQSHILVDLQDWFLNLDTFGTFVLMTAATL